MTPNLFYDFYYLFRNFKTETFTGKASTFKIKIIFFQMWSDVWARKPQRAKLIIIKK